MKGATEVMWGYVGRYGILNMYCLGFLKDP